MNHRMTDEVSLALARQVVEPVRQHPELMAAARANLAPMVTPECVHPLIAPALSGMAGDSFPSGGRCL